MVYPLESFEKLKHQFLPIVLQKPTLTPVKNIIVTIRKASIRVQQRALLQKCSVPVE
jgi:hypothetical protein